VSIDGGGGGSIQRVPPGWLQKQAHCKSFRHSLKPAPKLSKLSGFRSRNLSLSFPHNGQEEGRGFGEGRRRLVTPQF